VTGQEKSTTKSDEVLKKHPKQVIPTFILHLLSSGV